VILISQIGGPKPVLSEVETPNMYKSRLYFGINGDEIEDFPLRIYNKGDRGEVFIKIISDDVLISPKNHSNFNCSTETMCYVESDSIANYDFLIKLKGKKVERIDMQIECWYIDSLYGFKSTDKFTKNITYTLGDNFNFYLNTK
jgi:hypothetical protein